MAMLSISCGRDEARHCGSGTESIELRQKGMKEVQMSIHWLRCPLFILYILSALCAWIPSADACQQEHLPDHCFWEYQDNYEPCPLTHTEKVGCIYAKINSTDELLLANEDSEKFPSHPRSFAIKSYTSHFQSVHGCGHIFNITWKLPQDASFEYLQGFLLDIMFDHLGEPQRFLRHFQVQTKGLTAIDLNEIVFYYDCFIPRPNTFFQIRLRSLPIAPFEMSNDVRQSLQTYDNEVDVDLNNTGNWKASIWVKQLSADSSTSSSSVEICFTTAPLDFRFVRYNIYLLSSSSSSHPLRLIRYSAAVDVNQTESAVDACRTFDVCSDTYRIEIEPESDAGPDCKCKLESKCVASCQTSVFESADMTQSLLRCPPFPSLESKSPNSMTANISRTETSSQPESGKISGLVVGAFLSLVVLGLLGFIVWKRQRKTTTPNPKRVFILDSSDASDFQTSVRFMADFLRHRCHCQVHVLSDWLLTDTHSNLDNIWNRIVNADCTIFVMSDACRRHYRDAIMGVIRPPSGRNSVIHNAIVAMIMQVMCNNDHEALRRKCVEVYLPGNLECHELKKAVQRSYSFPGEFADLVWEVRGAKQSRFYHVSIAKLLEGRKVERDWKKVRLVLCHRTEVATECLGQKPVEDNDDDDEYSSNNNNRASLGDLNGTLEKEGQTRPLKSEVSKCDSGFSGSAILDILFETISFQPPHSRTQSSSTLSSSVGYAGDSLLCSSVYDFSTITIHNDDDDEDDSVA